MPSTQMESSLTNLFPGRQNVDGMLARAGRTALAGRGADAPPRLPRSAEDDTPRAPGLGAWVQTGTCRAPWPEVPAGRQERTARRALAECQQGAA